MNHSIFHVIENQWCSWCHKKTNHLLITRGYLTRNEYECQSCGNYSVRCRLCSNMATFKPEYQQDFKLSYISLEKLKMDGLPEDTLDKLTPLLDKLFTSKIEFLNQVKEIIGDEQSFIYRNSLLKHGVVKNYKLTLHSLKKKKKDNVPEEIITKLN
ncbi:MAG: hypothetical protein HQK77_05985, partial [Desulfobacterales bacterium]|nr:hypothetical protein [Desulfobacterales bacterium]